MPYKKISKKEAKQFYEKGVLARHPNSIMKTLSHLISEVGAEKFLHGAGYNEKRDALIGSLFAYAIRKYTGQEWFLRQIDDPPDFEILSYSNKPIKDKPGLHAKVEIVEIPQIIDEKDDQLKFAVNLLLRTKLRKEYKVEKGTILLIFVNAKCSAKLCEDLKNWLENNKGLLKSFGDIFALYFNAVTRFREGLEYTVFNLSKDWFLVMNSKEEYLKKPLETPYLGKFGVKIE